VKFELRRLGVALAMKEVACMAMAGGRLVPLLEQTTNGTSGRCSWAVPSTARGKTLSGLVAVVPVTGPTYFLGYDLPVS
jgi:hypothetical protein